MIDSRHCHNQGSLEVGTISCVRRVSSEDMLANSLTKAGASAERLLEVLQSGKYELPEGLDIEQ